MPDLSTTYLGLTLRNPLVVSAGPLCESVDNIRHMEDAGAGAVVLHSLFEEQITLESQYLDRYLTDGTDSFAESLTYFPDVASYRLGPDDYLEHVRRAKAAVGIPVVGSLNGVSSGGWTHYAKKIEPAGADAIELNVYYIPTDPDLTGGRVEQMYAEDKMAVLWSISSPAFEQRGCMSACHTGEGKPYGNKYTANGGERLDMWHWKGVRTGTIGQVDDQYVDHTRYDPDKAKEAGRKSDPKTGGGYSDNVTEDKKGPRFALKGNKPAPPYWIVEGEKEPFDDSKYKGGDEVPGIIVAPFTGDRGDISARSVWKDGTRTVVLWRKLTTGSESDVQFNDLKKEYAFGVAVFDNAQVRHAYTPGVLKLKFE
jgi:Ethylbenzene dehydrogenase